MTIEQVGPSRQITTKYGPRNVYSVKFQGNENWADVMQKPELPQPTVGQQMEGTIEKNQYGYTFRKTQTGFPGSGAMRSSGNSNRQVALQAATQLRSGLAVDVETVIQAAETLLKWLEVQDTAPQQATPTEPQNAPQGFEGLGL